MQKQRIAGTTLFFMMSAAMWPCPLLTFASHRNDRHTLPFFRQSNFLLHNAISFFYFYCIFFAGPRLLLFPSHLPATLEFVSYLKWWWCHFSSVRPDIGFALHRVFLHFPKASPYFPPLHFFPPATCTCSWSLTVDCSFASVEPPPCRLIEVCLVFSISSKVKVILRDACSIAPRTKTQSPLPWTAQATKTHPPPLRTSLTLPPSLSAKQYAITFCLVLARHTLRILQTRMNPMLLRHKMRH